MTEQANGAASRTGGTPTFTQTRFLQLKRPSGGPFQLQEPEAERVDWSLYPTDEDYDYVVLADPEGNRFCVIR
jgi:hypothetical protein